MSVNEDSLIGFGWRSFFLSFFLSLLFEILVQTSLVIGSCLKIWWMNDVY